MNKEEEREKLMKMFTNEPLASKQSSDNRLEYSENGSSLNDREEVDFNLTKTNKKNVSFANTKSGMKNKSGKMGLSKKKINEAAQDFV